MRFDFNPAPVLCAQKVAFWCSQPDARPTRLTLTSLASLAAPLNLSWHDLCLEDCHSAGVTRDPPSAYRSALDMRRPSRLAARQREPNEPGRRFAESLLFFAPAVRSSATPTCQAHGEDRALIRGRGHEHAAVPAIPAKQPSGPCFGTATGVRAPTLSATHHDRTGAAPGAHELRRAMSRSPRRAQKLSAPFTGSRDRNR